MSFRKLPLPLKIFVPTGILVFVAHMVMYFHVARILETERIFEAIIVSLLERNIMGSMVIFLIITFGISYYIAQVIQQETDAELEARDVLKNLDLNSLDLDPDFEVDEMENLTPEAQITEKAMSKDLIHPLAAILGHAQLAKLKNPSADILSNLEFIETESRRIKKLVEGSNPGVPKERSARPLLHPHKLTKIGKEIIANHTRANMPPEPVEIPDVPAFPKISPNLGFDTQLKLTWQESQAHENVPSNMPVTSPAPLKSRVRRPVVRSNHNET